MLEAYRALFRLDGRRAIVVGAGSGIGEASAEALAAHGAHVVCGDLDGAKAEAVAMRIRDAGGSAEAVKVDVRDTASVEAALDLARAGIVVSTPGAMAFARTPCGPCSAAMARSSWTMPALVEA